MASFFMTVLTIAGIALAVGTLAGLCFGGLLLLYSLPYACWLGWNKGSNGIPKTLNSEGLPALKGLLLYSQNSTKLYRSWITKKPHGITNF